MQPRRVGKAPLGGQRYKTIAGPRVYICDKCVDACIEILGSDYAWREPMLPSLLPSGAPVEFPQMQVAPAISFNRNAVRCSPTLDQAALRQWLPPNRPQKLQCL
jgi:hypothetical protein